jgi:hypothetical protein
LCNVCAFSREKTYILSIKAETVSLATAVATSDILSWVSKKVCKELTGDEAALSAVVKHHNSLRNSLFALLLQPQKLGQSSAISCSVDTADQAAS